MNEWKKVSLDQMGTVSRGKSKHRPRNDARLFGGKYPFIQTGDIGSAGLYVNEFSQTYNEEGLAQSKLWEKDTLCITIAANIADTALLAFPACFPDSIMGFVADPKISNVKFVKYCFDILQRDCKQISQGAAQDNLSWKKLSTIEFPCPPIEVQHRIATILSRYDSLIENYQKQIKLLEEAAQRLYKEWFIDLRFPGHENTNLIDGVPEGWEKKKVGEIAPIITGKKDANFGTPNGEYPFFTCSQEPIKAPSFSFDCAAVLLAGNGDFNVKLYRGKFEAYQRTYVLSPYCAQHLYLLYYTISANMTKLAAGSSGSTIKFLTKGMIDGINLNIPNDEILRSFNKKVEPIQSSRESLQSQLRLLTEARDRLLPKLMSGEITV